MKNDQNYDLIDSTSLWRIHRACLKLVDLVEDSLVGMLTSADNFFDDADARRELTKSVAAAKCLLSHFGKNYEIGNNLVDGISGSVEVKAGTCLE